MIRVAQGEAEYQELVDAHRKRLQTGSALETQIGGDHYKGIAIQPTEFIQRNGLNWCEGNIVKYACRHRVKNGIEDVRKIIHYAELLIELEYCEKKA